MGLTFVVDGMLGSLARKLRMFGFDTLYRPYADDEWIITIGKKSCRVVLTSDRGLFEASTKHGVECVLLTEPSDEERLITVFRTLELHSQDVKPQATRCPLCNGLLEASNKEGIETSVPHGVRKRYTEFYTCRDCMKVYWEGSHWARILQLSRRVQKRLRQA